MMTWTDDKDFLLNHTCPDCGGKVMLRYTCHTWIGPTGTWMSCQGCNSAVDYCCAGHDPDGDEDGCGWWYTNGLNPKNPSTESNEDNRPDWMPSPKEDPWL